MSYGTITAQDVPDAFDLMEEARWEMEGVRRAEKRYRKAAEATDAASLPSGQRMLREIVPPLIEAIREAQSEGLEKIGNGRLCKWCWPIQLLEPDRLAVITVVNALRAVTGPNTETTRLPGVGMALADSIRDEIEYLRWMKEQGKAEPGERDVLDAFKRTYPAPNRAVWSRWRRKVQAARCEPWEKEVQLALGVHLVHLLCKVAPDRFSVVEEPRAGNVGNVKCLEASQATMELMSDIETRAALARPRLMPMIIPPKPWRYAD